VSRNVTITTPMRLGITNRSRLNSMPSMMGVLDGCDL
jgi:hypothetical protein